MNNSKIETDQDIQNIFRIICKEEFLKFCENTTIRGVPRIVKSRSLRNRYLWLAFVILLFGGFVICITFLLSQYLEYNVIHPPRILSDNKAPFPSMTVCNFRPLSRNIFSIMKKFNIKTPREFAHSINKYAIKHFYKKNLKNDYMRATSVMNMGSYLGSVPNSSYAELGHELEDFIIYCQATYMVGSKPQAKYCNEIGTWRMIVHAQYINCYSFNLNSDYSKITNTIELFLYLDQIVPPTLCIDCFAGDVKSQLSGALILIHQRLTFPNFNHDIINLQPGTLTEIKLKIFHNVHKQPPYGRCSRNAPKTLEMYNESYAYSEHACKLLTIQHEINEICGCNAIEHPFDNKNLPFCGHLPRFISHNYCHNNLSDEICFDQINHVVKELTCKANVSSRYNKDIILSCPLSCAIYSYESDRSTSSWPTKAWQAHWMNTNSAIKIRKKPELQPYLEAYMHYRNGDLNQTFSILEKETILEQRLLAVMLNRPNYNVHLVEEKEVLSLTSFMSQIGGLCSIWLGLTLISIVEVIEMIMNCTLTYKNKKNKLRKYNEEHTCPHQRFDVNDQKFEIINSNKKENDEQINLPLVF